MIWCVAEISQTQLDILVLRPCSWWGLLCSEVGFCLVNMWCNLSCRRKVSATRVYNCCKLDCVGDAEGPGHVVPFWKSIKGQSTQHNFTVYLVFAVSIVHVQNPYISYLGPSTSLLETKKTRLFGLSHRLVRWFRFRDLPRPRTTIVPDEGILEEYHLFNAQLALGSSPPRLLTLQILELQYPVRSIAACSCQPDRYLVSLILGRHLRHFRVWL